jgi:hypothetical protein
MAVRLVTLAVGALLAASVGCETTPPAQRSSATQTEARPAATQPALHLDAAREALQRNIATLPNLDLTFEKPDLTLAPPPDRDPNEVITLYLGDYALDMPRDVYGQLYNPWLFRFGAGFLTTGDCRLTLFIDEELNIARPLRELVKQAEPAVALNSPVAGVPAETLVELWPQVRERIVFPHDYALLSKLYATDFTKLDLAALSAVDLIEVMFLIEIKPIVVPDGADVYVARVQTPAFEGFAYGRLDRGERAWVDLHDHNLKRIKFIMTCFERWNADAGPLRQALPTLVGSVRRHGSDTPGADMLAGARAELAADRDEKSTDIARCLVLCASRYDDAFAAAVELGKSLVDDETPQGREYLAVLQRAWEGK